MNPVHHSTFLRWSILLLLLGGLLDGARFIVARDAEAMAGVSRGRPTGFYGH
jgi:hypothetical protein